MTIRLTKVTAGEYRALNGEWTIAREDVPSLDEWDQKSGDVTWYAIPTRAWLSGGSLPDAAHEASTRTAVVAWLEEQQ